MKQQIYIQFFKTLSKDNYQAKKSVLLIELKH